MMTWTQLKKINAELAHMEWDWAETQSGPFLKGVQNTFKDLRAEQAKLDTEATRAVNDVQHVTATATTATITAPANATIPPTTQTDPAMVPTWIANDNCDTFAKVKSKLLRMQEYWAESQTGPFPESVQNVIEDLRASFEK
jgi:hypothetical protein